MLPGSLELYADDDTMRPWYDAGRVQHCHNGDDDLSMSLIHHLSISAYLEPILL